MNGMDKAKRAVLSATVNHALGCLEKDPESNIPKLMALVDTTTPDVWYVSQRRLSE